jgi:glyoxylase-like metal-dependent hydrolase (beta-lactamase superfamily II)
MTEKIDELIKDPNWHSVTKEAGGEVTAVRTPKYWEDECNYFLGKIGVDMGSIFADMNMAYDTANIEYILLTHAHEDHTGGGKFYKKKPMVYYYDDEYGYERNNLIKGMRAGVDFTPYAPHQFAEGFVPKIDLNKQVIPSYPAKKTKSIKPFEEFTLDNRRIMPILVSGHTPGSIMYLFLDEGWLFPGDNAYDGPLQYIQKEALLPKSNVNTYIRDYIAFYKTFRPLVKKVFPGHNHPVYEPVLLDYIYELVTNIDKATVVDAGITPKGVPLSSYFLPDTEHRVSIVVPKGYNISAEQ